MLEHLTHPQHCFCQIPAEKLRVWARRRFIEKRPTVDLLASTDDPCEKEIIGIVALLDVDEAALLNLMGNVNLPEHHILHCRENVKKMLGKEYSF